MNSKGLTAADRAHMGSVKSLPCSVCPAPGPSVAHHIKQGSHYTTVALCVACHTGSGGWHGDKTAWKTRKMDELAALNITLMRLAGAETKEKVYKRPDKVLARNVADDAINQMSVEALITPMSLRDYAKAKGWALVTEGLKDGLYVMSNPRFDRRQLVFPMDEAAQGCAESIARAVEKLAAMEQRAPEEVRMEIRKNDHDRN